MIHQCMVGTLSQNGSKTSGYIVSLKDGRFDVHVLKAFSESKDFFISRLNRKGKLIKINLKDIVLRMELISSSRVKMVLKSEPGKTVRPFEVVTTVFNLPEDIVKRSDVVKIPID